MRNRTTAGLAAGAVVSSLLAAPFLATPAHAAPQASVVAADEETASAPLEVTAFGATIGYDPAFQVTQVKNRVTLGQAAFGPIAGPPPFVQVSRVKVDAVFDLNGTDIEATGVSGDDFVTGPLANGFVNPDLTLELPANTPAGELSLKSYKITLTVGSSDSVLDFDVVEPVSVAIDKVGTLKPLEVTAFGATIGYDPEFVATQDGADLTLAQAAFGPIAGPPPFVRVNAVKVDAVFDVNGADVAATGVSGEDFVAGPLADGFVNPDLKLTLPAGTPAGDITLKSYKITMTVGTSDSELVFEVVEPVKVAIDAVHHGKPLEVTSFGATIGHDPAFVVSQDGAEVTLAQSDFGPIAGPPPFVRVNAVKVDAVFDVNGADVAATGVSGEDFVAGPLADGFATPDLKLTLPAGTPAGDITLKSYKITLTVGTSESVLDFTVLEPVKVAVDAVPVVEEPQEPEPEQPVVKTKPKLNKVKANFAKKKKVLTVKGQVKGSNGKATGKVKITVKKGKKTVKNVTVKLNKKGAFTKKIKKIKGKGKFKVVIQFQGDANYKKAKKTISFRVK